MHYFTVKKNNLYCENLRVRDLVKKYSSPLYIYSARTILEHLCKLQRAFSALEPLICYSVKANSNLSILKLLVSKGAGLDIVSGGELYRAKRINCNPKRIVYASVGKTTDEIEEAIKSRILMFNVESTAELKRIDRVAKRLGKCVDVALRFNPDVGAKTHKYITTGKKETKFGIDYETVKRLFLNRSRYPNLDIVGIHMHIGSQITESAPYLATIRKANKLIEELRRKKISVNYLNIGGGLGIIYDQEKPQTAQDFAKKVLPLLRESNCKIILEPGRFIVGNAGILVTKVIYLKDTPAKKFIIVDAAMNDLMRPSLYGAYHKIMPITSIKKGSSGKLADVVGPICESGDFLGKDRCLDVSEGQFLAVMGAGAYGFAMSSNYNSRPRIQEVLVKNNRSYLIRKKETYQDLVKLEIIL